MTRLDELLRKLQDTVLEAEKVGTVLAWQRAADAWHKHASARAIEQGYGYTTHTTKSARALARQLAVRISFNCPQFRE